MQQPSPSANEQQAGVALVTVLLASLIIGGLVAVLVSSALVELRSTAAASAYEAGIHTAEQAIETTFSGYRQILEDDEVDVEACTDDPVCADLNPTNATAQAQRAAVLSVIDRDDGLLPVTEAGPGSFAVGPFKAEDGRVYVYGAAFIDPGTDRERTRVVRVQLGHELSSGGGGGGSSGGGGGGQIGPIGDQAILINGDVNIAGNLHRLAGTVHANGNLTMRDYIFESNQDLRNNTGPWSATGEVTCTDPNAYHGGCYRAHGLENDRPELAPLFRSGQPEIEVPRFEAAQVHAAWAYPLRDHWFDLCYPGLRHPTHATVVQPSSPEDGPCEGEIVYTITGSWPHAHYQGWRYETNESKFFRSWGGMPDDGVYYAHHRNVDTNALGSSTKRITVIASHDPDDLNGASSGNIFWRGNSHYLFFENDDGFQLAAFADRDIDGRNGTHRAEGVIYAREQIRLGGFSDITGQVVAAGSSITHPELSTTPSSPVTNQNGTESWTGSIYVTYAAYSFDLPATEHGPGEQDGGQPDDSSGSLGDVEVFSWEEL